MKSLWGFGYYFDTASNKCYTETNQFVAWTDGTTYKGTFNLSGNTKEYSIFSARLSKMDYELNLMISELVLKIDKKKEFQKLIDCIKSDKPRLD